MKSRFFGEIFDRIGMSDLEWRGFFTKEMAKNLVIVESPAKGKTIAKFLGKDFEVRASMGHIRDLPKKKTDLPAEQQKLKFATLGIDVENDFAPLYVVTPDKKKIAAELKKLTKEADKVWLATDEDREGEAIAWHLCEVLKLDPKTTPRIVFHEITEKAINDAKDNPRFLDFDKVMAQQARRVLDRLVGYELSPLLWKKIRYGLSAGRVQSVAVRIIVDRELERQKFQNEEYGEVGVNVKTEEGKEMKMVLEKRGGKKVNSIKPRKEGETSREILNKISVQEGEKLAKGLEGEKLKIKEVEQKERKSQPAPPFTTSSLQRDASTRLGWPVQKTMRVAQKLYEAGNITYMRTDSMTLSQQAIKQAVIVAGQEFGQEYVNETTRQFKSKSKGAQEAHEAIRPTDFARTPKSLGGRGDEGRLYELIWQRAIATQMSPAILAQTKVVAENGDLEFGANGKIVKFAGFTKAYPVGTKENVLPEVKEGEGLKVEKAEVEKKETMPPPRYTEAALVKKMEEEGIGRPSTYAPTIATIIARGYVDRDDNKSLFPSDTAFVVVDLLKKHFEDIVDLKFTAGMEEKLDEVAEGKVNWVELMKDFYRPWHERIMRKDKEIKKEDVTNLGETDEKCPECGKDLQIKLGKFGKFLSCTGFPECKFGKPMDGDEQAEPEISDEKCSKCGEQMLIKQGRFGPFLACSGYPKCKNTKPITKGTGVSCVKCEKGEIVEKKSRYGKIFFACDQYPDCKAAYWQKPIGKICKVCGDHMVMQKRGPVCGNVECDSRGGKKKGAKKTVKKKVASKKKVAKKK